MLNRRAAVDPGRLRLRLVLEKPVRTADGAGGARLGWNGVGIVAADLVPLRPDQRPTGQGIADLVLHKVVIRYRTDVEPADRLRLGGRSFLLLAVTDPQEDGRYLACLAEEEKP